MYEGSPIQPDRDITIDEGVAKASAVKDRSGCFYVKRIFLRNFVHECSKYAGKPPSYTGCRKGDGTGGQSF